MSQCSKDMENSGGSLCVQIISFNEEDAIRDCLESVRWAKDVLVIDSYSTDNTVSICKSFPNVRVEQRSWSGYGEQRNYGLSLTKAAWILVLDADERISDKLREEIEIIIAMDNPKYDGYKIPYKTFLGNMVIQELCPENVLRLFRRSKGVFSTKLVHESVKINGRIAKLHSRIFHYSCPNLENMIVKSDQYSTLAAHQMYKDHKKTNVFALVAHASFGFVKMYFLRGRIIGGTIGFITSLLHGVYVFMKYAKLWEMQHRNSSLSHGWISDLD